MKGIKIINKEFRKIYDCIILDEIGNNSDFNFNNISSQLRCSKSIIIDRIESLIDDGYIEIIDNCFVLTELGYKSRLSAENYSYDRKNINDFNLKCEYDWGKIYIPKADVFD